MRRSLAYAGRSVALPKRLRSGTREYPYMRLGRRRQDAQGRAHQGMVQDRILEPTRQAQTQDHEDFERVIGDATVEVKIWPFFCYSPPDGYGGHSCQQQRNERFRVVRLPVRE